MRNINVGIVGFGTIGAGVADILIKKREELKNLLGFDIVLKKIVDIDLVTDRGVDVSKIDFSDNAENLLNDEDISIVIELVGGCGFAKDFVLKAIDKKKNIVTANKALIAKHGEEIFAKAKKNGVDIYYEASVAGTIPVIKIIKESLLGNTIERIFGIINGTSNYVLTEMAQKGVDFGTALKKAQKIGIAELDPTFDIEGTDAAHKLSILSSLASCSKISVDNFYVEGIIGISDLDMKFAEELGYKIKLLAIYQKRDLNKIEVRVHPAMIPSESTLAVIDGDYNAVMIRGDNCGEILLKGKGAGRYPTASAVVSDVIDIARNINKNCVGRVTPDYHCNNYPKEIVPFNDIETEYYFRFTTIDKPGVIAKITTVFGDCGVSIRSMIQKKDSEEEGSFVPVVILTHKTKQGIVDECLKILEKKGDIIKEKICVIRVEEI